MRDRRRLLGALAVCLATAPLGGRAQPAGLRRIGYLANGNPDTANTQLETFRARRADEVIR